VKFLIITHASHILVNDQVYSYAPYVREMDLWNALVDEVCVVAPVSIAAVTKIDLAYKKNPRVKKISELAFITLGNGIKSLINLPIIFWILFIEMRRADHIHLRCPGTIGLVGCIVQVLFPKKKKTAKYAGNWDPKAKQPLSYKLQKWILSNTFLTKNMQVLVYGEWEGQSKNIKSFFTASYWNTEKSPVPNKTFSTPYTFLFVGSLVAGKRPLYAIQLVEKLVKNGIPASLTFYGDGVLRQELELYVAENGLNEIIVFKGNQAAKEVKKGYQEAHFLLLASKSEGWPKVVVEAMFWGAIPVSTAVSCVPWMLDHGARGLLLTLDQDQDMELLISLLENKPELQKMSAAALIWSRQYTLDTFEQEISNLLQ
jgi:glycosyltransferase involved in cell wall biosynthesis